MHVLDSMLASILDRMHCEFMMLLFLIQHLSRLVQQMLSSSFHVDGTLCTVHAGNNATASEDQGMGRNVIILKAILQCMPSKASSTNFRKQCLLVHVALVHTLNVTARHFAF